MKFNISDIRKLFLKIHTRYFIAATALILFIIISLLLSNNTKKYTIDANPIKENNQQIIEPQLSAVSDLDNASMQDFLSIFNNMGAVSDEVINELQKSSTLEKIDISHLGPKETYLIIRSQFDKIKNLSDLISFMSMYTSSQNITVLKYLPIISDIMGEEVFINEVKSHFNKDIVSTNLVLSLSNRAEIEIISKDNKIGKAIMVLEEGEWKLESETW